MRGKKNDRAGSNGEGATLPPVQRQTQEIEKCGKAPAWRSIDAIPFEITPIGVIPFEMTPIGVIPFEITPMRCHFV